MEERSTLIALNVILYSRDKTDTEAIAPESALLLKPVKHDYIFKKQG